MSSPPGKSRGGTPEGVRALQGARRSASCGGYGLRLTAFRFPFLSWFFLGLRSMIVKAAGRHRRRHLTKIGL
jgi:hypothetical protein